MNDELRSLVEEIGSPVFHPITQEQRDRIRQSTYRTYSPERYTSMSFEQSKRFSDATDRMVFPQQFDSDEQFFKICERIKEAWPTVSLTFSGKISEYKYLDTLFLSYNTLDDEQSALFEQFCVIHFKRHMSTNVEDNAGICPLCSDEITLEEGLYRSYASDDLLWAAPDEFDFEEYPDMGPTVRLWWD